MHFNVYIDDQTGQQLNAAAQQQGQTRNALIRMAVRDWLARQNQPKWPEEVLDFQGMADMLPFEAGREQLKPPVADPLA
ncbi:MAG: ribbon-helix-helix protein, CopG family [Gammaproteobacteria bacterium]|nr:ribbon-helix-helix protein, CopG family [Gammaproteobacteria bacterium]MBU1732646.1 ribbon-helix-helix protein, CopG family [Gammaproteobacteria bacterium]MBU1893509.1 ribbon-helix-helix protein, CopG family [Gammaproteobacteria bacterium]